MIRIKKGLDLPIEGVAEYRVSDARDIATYAVKPTDFVGLVPKLLVAEGDRVSAGDALFCDKNDDRIRFVSPVDGEVQAVVRGEKRKLLAVVVKKASASTSQDKQPVCQDDLKKNMLDSGLWALLRQRPFGTVASPDSTPKAIVVSCFDSAPLAPDYDFAMQGRESDLCEGLEALASLTEGTLFVTSRPGGRLARFVEQHVASKRKNVRVEYFEGPHPAGNVGTQIACLCPIKEDQTLNPDYPAIHASEQGQGRVRVVSGNVLSGSRIAEDGFLGAYDSLLTLLPEGDYYDFMGWLLPGLTKHSFSRTFASGFVPRCMTGIYSMLPEFVKPKFDTNVHGGVRPLVFTGNFERVFPFDIYPLQLLKACIIGDIDLMEKLGIYEVEPEDFALCEYIDPSKTDIQPIIREALEKLRKEAV